MFTMSDFFSIVSVAYLLAFVVAAVLVLWLVRPPRWKWSIFVALTTAFAYPLVTGYLEQKEKRERANAIQNYFLKLCKEKAGDRIVRTVENVDGFLLMRPRKPVTHREYLDQHWMGDPYGHSNLEAENPGHVFLRDRTGDTADFKVKITPIAGFEFIEMPNPNSVTQPSAPKYQRIIAASRSVTKSGERKIELRYEETDELRSRYGLTWDDISSPEDRKIWIAGGRMRVVDLQTQEVLGERIGFVIDPEQGKRFGGGVSWLIAQRTACPSFESTIDKTKEFVAKVLKSSRSK